MTKTTSIMGASSLVTNLVCLSLLGGIFPNLNFSNTSRGMLLVGFPFCMTTETGEDMMIVDNECDQVMIVFE